MLPIYPSVESVCWCVERCGPRFNTFLVVQESATTSFPGSSSQVTTSRLTMGVVLQGTVNRFMLTIFSVVIYL